MRPSGHPVCSAPQGVFDLLADHARVEAGEHLDGDRNADADVLGADDVQLRGDRLAGVEVAERRFEQRPVGTRTWRLNAVFQR